MSIRYIPFLFGLVCLLQGYAQTKFAVSQIPEELKVNSNLVVRENHVEFEITSKSKANYRVHEVLTILSPKAKDNAYQAIFYDKLKKVVSLKANVYDQKGMLLKKLKQSDFEDRSAISGYSLYEDSRMKVADLTHQNYPYTIEMEYELSYGYLFFIPTFFPMSTTSTSVEHASFALKFPPSLAPRYKVKNLPEGVPDQVVGIDGSVQWVWKFNNLKPITKEELGGSLRGTFPHIMSAPTQFEYAGYSGSMDNWAHFGDWINSLNQGRDELTPETKAFVRKLKETHESLEEKTEALYKFLQQKTRYVSIQLGIGGFQPFEAKVVDQVGYGDCKALSNYMIALLKEAEIKASYILIRAGSNEDEIDPDFTSTQFNHVIVAVPNKADTIWLECTSQSAPFGYLGSFTADRYALAVSSEGSRIIRTPKVQPDQNFQHRKATFLLSENGGAVAQVVTTYSGLECENNGLNFIDESQSDGQQNWITQNTPSAFSIEKFGFKKNNSNPPQIHIDATFTISRLAPVTGKRVFISPNTLNKFPLVTPSSEERVDDFTIHKSFTHIDSIEFNFPEGLYPETIPADIHLTNPFGEYQVNFLIDNGKITYIRKLKMIEGRFPASTYKDFGLFIKEINKADNQKFVLVNKT